MKKIVYLITLTFFAFMDVSFSVAEEAQVLVFKIHDQEPGNSSSFIPIPPEYDPKGKLDPFKPWFSENQSKPDPVHHQADCISNPVLQSIDLGQLRLTGIILSKSGNKALFQEASGKGQVAFQDTCIGRHGGKVASIQKRQVIVQEETKDVYGKVSVREIELKLHKQTN